MPEATFLETFPLYRKFPTNIPATLDEVSKPRINMDCNVCGDVRTFAMVNEYWHGKPYSNFPSRSESVAAQYTCVSCTKFTRWFYIWIAEDRQSIVKIGQYPAWSVKPDQDISKMLGQHKNYLSRGLICESQSYGIAAFAYYRRITEEIIDALLDDIAAMISDEDRAAYSSALDEVKKTRVTAEKIDLVKDLLPPILRPSGMNPLALLHGILSEGLHAQSDEDCLELAVEVREILTFLATQVAAANASSRSFTERMKSLLDKRSKPLLGN
jgi:hypothetical protein